jgi:hypothetical protein
MPAGFFAPRVKLAVDDLVAQLQSLVTLAAPIKHEITSEPDFGLPFQITTAEPLFLSDLPAGSTVTSIPVHVRGNGFQATPTVLFQGTRAPSVQKVYFRSETLLIVVLARTSVKLGTSDVVVTNADGQTLTLSAGFTVGP